MRILIHIKKEPTFHCGNRVDSTMDRPEVPPNAKWLGVLKMEIPTAVKISPRFKTMKKIRLSFVKIFFFIGVSSPFWLGSKTCLNKL